VMWLPGHDSTRNAGIQHEDFNRYAFGNIKGGP
jgi:hypothetical protein